MSTKRLLTEYEIDDIISIIKIQDGIPIETSNSVSNANKEALRQQLKNQLIYPEMIKKLKKSVEEQYFSSLIQPGESVGVIGAQSIGEKQTQTSVVYDEKIMIKHKDKIIITTVGEYIDNEMKYGIIIEIDTDAFVKPLEKGIQILTVSQEEKMEWKDISELSRHPVNGCLMKITTHSGRQVTTTLSHSHLKKCRDSIIPVLGSELKIGDRIPVAKKIPRLNMYKNLDIFIDIWSGFELIEEMIPYDIGVHIRRASYKLNIKERYIYERYEIFKKDISRYSLGKIINKLKEKSREKNINIDNELYFMELVYNSDIVWDKILNIDIIDEKDYKYKYVYDFSVKDNETFTLLSGIVVHNTLNTFHKAGQSEKAVTTGVPRVEELLNATKDPKTITCNVYMKDEHKTIGQVRETIGYDIVELTFGKISNSYEIFKNKEEESWYDSFKIIYGDTFTKYTDCISLKLNMDILFEYKLNMETIRDILALEYSDMECVFSPDNIGQMDIFVDNAREIYLEEVVQPLLYKIVICGVEGINAIYFKEDVNSLETDGSNFYKILGLPFVDATKTMSNNVWDIYNTLGIEASRQFLIEEFMGIMEGINKCHIQLLAEKMTHSGIISSISRYTMRTEESGPFSKASFEETMDNFLKAGIYGQEEETKGVSSSIICGKRSQIGSGFCELRIDVEALPNQVRILNEVEENINIVTPKYSTVTNKFHKTNIEPSEYIPKKKIKEPKKNTKKNSDDEGIEQTTYLDF